MLFNRLVKEIEITETQGNLALEIKGIAFDSRKVQPGFVFVAIQGYQTDGHEYIEQAIAKGAVALVVEKTIDESSVPWIKVSDSRLALAKIAVAYYQYPSSKMTLTGVTGTNGKTTTTHLIAAIYKKAGNKVGLMGTIHNVVGGKELSSNNTTPESLDVQELLHQMVESGVTYGTMEVSSHALALNRVAGVEFAAAVFTNLTQDHLDFHQNMDEYAQAKAKLFTHASLAIINADDPRAAEMINASSGEVITYGIHSKADVMAHKIKVTAKGVSFSTVGKYGEHCLNLKLTGEFNVYNSLAAFTTAMAQGFKAEMVIEALEEVPGVPGRFQLVDCGQPFAVIVDYAHTPDGLVNILQTARKLTEKRVITVFGCGGDRDKTKRPIMGEIATELSDIPVVTSDNPRTEDPDKIIADVMVGVKRQVGEKEFAVMADRYQAIAHALKLAQQGDVVIIAGKGHENYQILGTVKHDFDDVAVAKEVLAQLGYQK